MRKINDWENVKEAEEFESLTPGGYIAKIMNIEDDVQKECLKISFDIADGKFKDYYMNLYKTLNFWGGTFYRSYKDSAKSFFKGFITAVENSNQGYRWDWNEQSLKGKKVGIVLREEDYIPEQGPNAGKVKTRLIVDQVHSIDKIRKGDFKIKEKKPLATNTTDNSTDTIEKTFDFSENDIAF